MVHVDGREPLRRIFEGVMGIPFTDGNRIDVLRNGDEIFPAMLAAVEQAEQRIDFLTYIYWSGDIARRFAQALADRARAGVRVNVLLDSVGAMSMARELIDLMIDAGADVRWFRPLSTWKFWRNDNRTHRKVLVVDGQVGFTGGVGIAAEWQGDARNANEWRDTHFRIQGPAVWGLQGAFFANWTETGRPLPEAFDRIHALERAGPTAIQVVRATSTLGWSDVATLLQLIITTARQRLRIASAYFVPDPVTLRYLCEAARRGVEVSVMLPGQHMDSRLSQLASEDIFRELLDSGVAIHRYQRSMLHTKTITLDGCLTCIGSANFNQRSMCRDEEIALIVLDEQCTAVLDEYYDDDLELCTALQLGRWRKRTGLRRLLEKLIQPLRPQL